MPKFTVIVSDEELKALEWDIYNVQDWIQNAISEKARRTMCILIEQNTNLNPRKLSKVEKETHVRGMAFDTAKERTDKHIKELELKA